MFIEAELKDVPEPLRAKILELNAVENRVHHAESRAVKAEAHSTWAAVRIKHLEEENRRLRFEKYGPSSEQLTPEQTNLLDAEPCVSPIEAKQEADQPAAAKAEVEIATRPRTPRGLESLPSWLPRVEVIIPCADADCTCSKCQQPMPVIRYENSEKLHRIPAKFEVHVLKKEVRACACEEGSVVTAPTPPQIIPKGIATDAVVVEAVIQKFEAHLPCYRQSILLEREQGIILSRQTICGWLMAVGFLLTAITRVMLKDLIDGGYIQADETPVGVQSKETKGKNLTGYFWEYSRPGGPVVFDFQPGRSRAGPEKILRGFQGILQTDDYSVYNSVCSDGIIAAACMAHVRRKFYEASQIYKEDTRLVSILGIIGGLYLVEREARERKLGREERLELRRQRSIVPMQTLKAKIIALRTEVLPQSMQGKACNYALGSWAKLEVYLSNGQVEIDNNWCENAIRPIAIGRKNWLHLGSKDAGPKMAAIISVVETCHRLDVPVREYLLDVLPKLAHGKTSEVASLTPTAWKAARNKPAT